MSQCPFCFAEVREINFPHLNLRICPKCYSTFFPCNQTMPFRSELLDKTRELWFKALSAKNPVDPDTANAKCIDHGEPLVEGTLPDYGYPGKVTTCCGMFHLTPSLTLRLLEHTLNTSVHLVESKGKHHFFFIRWLDNLVSKVFGEKMPEEDPLDLIQYEHHFRDIFE